MEIRTLVDAGPLIGWLNAADQWHDWSVAALSPRKTPLHTIEIILGEALWHLGGNTKPAHSLLDLVRKKILILHRPWPEHLAHTQQVMLKYPQMDAADASLVTMAELFPRALVISTDRRDFKSCRGLTTKKLNLLLPE